MVVSSSQLYFVLSYSSDRWPLFMNQVLEVQREKQTYMMIEDTFGANRKKHIIVPDYESHC
jgi:microcystin-dependent protein